MMVVGYTYMADIWCPDCIVEEVCKQNNIHPIPFYNRLDIEAILDDLAKMMPDKFDRYDEHTFDSDEFPKVVFSNSMEGFEYCCCCHGEL
jgi:hypothetical protein